MAACSSLVPRPFPRGRLFLFKRPKEKSSPCSGASFPDPFHAAGFFCLEKAERKKKLVAAGGSGDTQGLQKTRFDRKIGTSDHCFFIGQKVAMDCPEPMDQLDPESAPGSWRNRLCRFQNDQCAPRSCEAHTKNWVTVETESGLLHIERQDSDSTVTQFFVW